MSAEGIKIAASVFEFMQNARMELMRLGTNSSPKCEVDKQDIRLSRLMEFGNDAMKDEFSKITMEK